MLLLIQVNNKGCPRFKTFWVAVAQAGGRWPQNGHDVKGKERVWGSLPLVVAIGRTMVEPR